MSGAKSRISKLSAADATPGFPRIAAVADAEVLQGADARHGYRFGCDGLMNRQEASQLLGGISLDTVDAICSEDDNIVRKGKFPGRKKVGICRRSMREYLATMEV